MVLQSAPTGNTTGNGTNASGGSGVTAPLSEVANPQLGPVGRFLIEFGLPYRYAAPLGAAVTSIALYAIGRAVVIPIVRRTLDARGLERHAERPLLRITRILVGFVVVAVAFGFAGYGNILTSLATIGAAATLAIGFALQDVLKNFVSGVFIYTDRPFRIGDWVE